MEVNAKDKEIIFLRNMVEQLQMQVSILQKGIKKKQKNPRYTLREKLFILWQMETYQIPGRRATEYLASPDILSTGGCIRSKISSKPVFQPIKHP